MWVRPLDAGETTPVGPIDWCRATSSSRSRRSTQSESTPTQRLAMQPGSCAACRWCRLERDDAARVVWVRTPLLSEPAPAERVRVPNGYNLSFAVGGVVVELDRVDQMFQVDGDGYTALSNTIWTWLSIAAPPGSEVLHRYLLAAARRLDAAHRSFEAIQQNLDTFDASTRDPMLALPSSRSSEKLRSLSSHSVVRSTWQYG